MTFAEQLKEARKSAGLTQQQLADMTLIPKRTIESWESRGKAGRDAPEWCQRLVLSEIERIKNTENVERLCDYLRETGQDEELRKVTGMDTAPSIVIERIMKGQEKGQE